VTAGASEFPAAESHRRTFAAPSHLAGVVAAAVAVAFRFWYASFRPLLPDEAYYWVWTRHLAGGYFDHPPMVAYMIWLSQKLFGSNELGVRALGILLMVAAGALVLRIARDMGVDRRGRLLLLAIWLTSPLLAGLATMMTPDTPAALFAAVLLALAVRTAVRLARGERVSWEWAAIGAAVGLALVSKYTAVLPAAAVAAAFLTHPRGRRTLLTPGPYIALLVALLCFSPVIVWNARHDWASFRFQLAHGLGAREKNPIVGLLRFLGGQLLMWTPVLFALGVVATASCWRRYRQLPLAERVLTWAATVPLAFFAYASLRTHGEENWPNLAYLPMGVLTVQFVGRAWDRRISAARVGCAVALAAALVIQFPELLRAARVPLPVSMKNLFGWRELGAEVGKARAETGADLVYADRGQDAGELAFYMPGRPDVWYFPPPGAKPFAYAYFDNPPDPRKVRRVVFVGNHADDFCRAYGYRVIREGYWAYHHGGRTSVRQRAFKVLERRG
jgi:4-amino-4-deoxy-L-arabinose transferase-like glycosyltransferase